ncbi:MAG: hypothetical protein NT090_22555, partial [Acidobacteria bacterium]|nr:hypothetical protein [Acidobacteriota bacterium]
ERATLARRLAGAFEKLDQPPAALAFYRISLEIAATAEARAAIARLRADFARRAENERRRPIVRDLLDQPLLVRPRLPSGTGGRPLGLAGRPAKPNKTGQEACPTETTGEAR